MAVDISSAAPFVTRQSVRRTLVNIFRGSSGHCGSLQPGTVLRGEPTCSCRTPAALPGRHRRAKVPLRPLTGGWLSFVNDGAGWRLKAEPGIQPRLPPILTTPNHAAQDSCSRTAPSFSKSFALRQSQTGMSSVRGTVLRHFAACPLRSARASTQRRWAQVHDVRRFLATARSPQSIQDKYRSKLETKAKREGHESIDALKAAYADKIDQQRRSETAGPEPVPQAPGTPLAQPNRDISPATKVKRTRAQDQAPVRSPGSPERPAVKTLDDILDLEKARDLPETELTAIWRLRHASSPQTLCAVVPASTYQAMEDVARTVPQFVLPVPHQEQGAEIHFLQWTFDRPSKTSTVLFTHLAEYKTRGEFAQPHTTITHHLDLAGEKGLVLMQGRVVDGRGMTAEQAKWLIMCLQKFYGGWDGPQSALTDGQRKERAEERKNLLNWFAQGDSRFTVEKLLEEAERMG